MLAFLCVLKSGFSRSLCLLALCFIGTLGLPAQQARVELLSDRSAIVPGEAFTLAVRIELDPDWHLYWRNPGASGLPLELTGVCLQVCRLDPLNGRCRKK